MSRLLPILLIVCSLNGASASAQQMCGVAKDYVVQAREKAGPGLDRTELERQFQQLKRATEYCAALGDAYYYRHLFARQLNNVRDARYSLEKARENGSEAMNNGIDPFIPMEQRTSGTMVLPPVRQKWALAIGVSKYLHRISPLRFPAKDARDFASLLLDSRYGRFKPENLRALTDEQATTKNIKEGLNWLARNADKNDLVVVFISAHGSPRELDTGGVSYVITYDTDASTQDSLYGSALEMIEIVDALSRRVRSQRSVLFIDTCFSGAVGAGSRQTDAGIIHAYGGAVSSRGKTEAGGKALAVEGTGVSSATLEHINYTRGRIVITASQPDERSWESESLQNGFFTYYLIQGLKLDGGKISVDQLYQYLREQVPKQVAAEKNVSQTPMMLPARPTVEITLGVEPQPFR